MRKNILVLVSVEYNTDEFKAWISEILENENLIYFVINENNLDKIDKELVVTDYVFNFLIGEKKEAVQEKIEKLKIDYFGNPLSIQRLFLEKVNFKKIISASKFKTAVFEKIDERSAIELFNNFPQPSRIFSKTNDFFSGQIESLKELEEILFKIDDKENYYIEEYIEGDDIYVFYFRFLDNNIIFSLKRNDFKFEKIQDEDLNNLIKKDIEEFINLAGIKDFAIFNLRFSKVRGLFFLNIFNRNVDLFSNREILEDFLKKNKHKELRGILKNLF